MKKQDITVFVKQVVDRFHPQRVILFGSYAYGKPTDDSDVDLLVVMPHEGHSAIQSAKIRQTVRAGFPMDLVVRSPSDIRRRLAVGDCFIKEIMERGRPLYDYSPALRTPVGDVSPRTG